MNKNIVCIGAGYIGGPTMAVIAKMNDHQQERIVFRLFKAMFNTLANKKIAMFGFAFKADTGDTRETPAGYVARLYRSMRKPALVFDTRNCLDSAALRKLGFKVLNIGK